MSEPRNLGEIVVVNHDGVWREEIEIKVRNENGESSPGTITITDQIPLTWLNLSIGTVKVKCKEKYLGF